jgi:integrase
MLRNIASATRHPVSHSPGMRLYDPQGHRLYLTSLEREAFQKVAEQAPKEVRTYCHTLLYTGCRPSEALALRVDHVDFQAQALIFESKKKRKPGIYRTVPGWVGARRVTLRHVSSRPPFRTVLEAFTSYGSTLPDQSWS